MSPISTILGSPPRARLGRVADRAQVALVQMLEAGEQHRARRATRIEVALDLDDRGHRVLGLAEELQADGAHVRRHPVQHPARRRDQAVAAFLLHAGQPGEELVGDVLAQAGLAEPRPSISRRSPRSGSPRIVPSAGAGAPRTSAGRTPRGGASWILPRLWPMARHFEPVALGVDHSPPGEVVERGAPQHGLLAAGVHRDVAADARRVERGRIDREHEPGALGGVGDAAGDDAGLGADRRALRVEPRQAQSARPRRGASSFSVLITADIGVSGTAPPV